MKRCFTCKRNYPLFCYQYDTSNYKIKYHMGKVVNCRLCVYKIGKEHGGVMQRFHGKFAFVPMTKKELIKYIFKK